MQITTQYPVVAVRENGQTDYVVVVLADRLVPPADFGAVVTLDAPMGRVRTNIWPLYVAGVDTLPASEIANDVLTLLGATSTLDFVQRLSRVYGTALPVTVEVTLYTLYDRPVEESAQEPDPVQQVLDVAKQVMRPEWERLNIGQFDVGSADDFFRDNGKDFGTRR